MRRLLIAAARTTMSCASVLAQPIDYSQLAMTIHFGGETVELVHVPGSPPSQRRTSS